MSALKENPDLYQSYAAIGCELPNKASCTSPKMIAQDAGVRYGFSGIFLASSFFCSQAESSLH
jgi:hypothetical protein